MADTDPTLLLDLLHIAWPALTAALAIGLAVLVWRQPLQSPTIDATNLQGEAWSVVNALPDEVLLHVFSFLDRGHDLAAASAVCSRWCQLGREETLWAALLRCEFSTSTLASVGTPSGMHRWSAAHHFPAHLRTKVQFVVRGAEGEQTRCD